MSCGVDGQAVQAPFEHAVIQVAGRPAMGMQQADSVAGQANVCFVQADAQTYPFPPRGFDLAISRSG